MTSATYTTFDAVGRVEDVSDIITNITPSKTPFLTAIGSDTTKNVEFKWQEDRLRASAANAKKEGADATVSARAATLMRKNVTQILSDTFKISDTQDTVKQYGRARETAYQTVKVGKELKLDLERAYVSPQTMVDAVDEDTARVTAGALAQIHADVTVDALGAGLTEDAIMDATEASANAGGTPDILMIRMKDAKLVAAFSGNATRTRDVSETPNKIVNSIDVYVTPYAELKVVKNLEMNAFEHALGLDAEMWADVVLRGYKREALAKTGDAETTMIVTERGLKSKNYRSGFAITNLDA
ncbi:hypothetical protein EUV02_03900 [Polymorphobacter arshaanensis]|uniref:Head protein n=1 Tax=Glacieibacterium arshaanense TaxID=2511025 RepID=A0A4Y9ERD6_9SPHN|nr:DUF5309 family protein [Polymorphobacter arshaanensis]TFU06164.1 hypothetical protein EUV02_03900 [Polymorphobacter arshaanensis]